MRAIKFDDLIISFEGSKVSSEYQDSRKKMTLKVASFLLINENKISKNREIQKPRK